MSRDMRGVSAIDLAPGDYAIVRAEWRRDANQQLSNLTSGSGDGDGATLHLHDVVRSDGTRVLEVVEDRRAMEGMFGTSGRRFLFRSPDGDPLMAYEREGLVVGTTATLEDLTAGEVLGSWEAVGLSGRLFKRNWRLADPGGNQRARAKREWSLRSLFSTSFDLTLADGTDIGRLSVGTDGLFRRMDVTLDRSPIPTEVLLAMSYGIFWALNQGTPGESAG